MDGKFNIDDRVTHTLRLNDINEGLVLMEREESNCSMAVFSSIYYFKSACSGCSTGMLCYLI